MSKPIVISIPHSLGKEEALRRLKPGLTGAARSFPVLKVDEEIWSGDRLTFRVRALG
ncbi:MAG: polyhydroxyalkanoic acid synthase, partial [Pseudorhodoplanes sp.]